jgi:hypothetical protein
LVISALKSQTNNAASKNDLNQLFQRIGFSFKS